jgi:hypothetical protein
MIITKNWPQVSNLVFVIFFIYIFIKYPRFRTIIGILYESILLPSIDQRDCCQQRQTRVQYDR